MTKIKRLISREILDSRGMPTIETTVLLSSGLTGTAAVPSGASTGSLEALELRDADPQRFLGKGMLKAVEGVLKLQSVLCGKDVTDQKGIDQLLCEWDGTPNKSNLGANAILSVSLAVCKAAACELKQELFEYLANLFQGRVPSHYFLPTPMVNVINGGAHASNLLDLQEVMLVPLGASTFRQAVQWSCEIFQTLKRLLREKGSPTSVGDEGGFAPDLESNEEAFDLLEEAVAQSGRQLGQEIKLAVDCAATQFFNVDTQAYELEGGNRSFTSDGFIDYLQALAKKYTICAIEDGLHEKDWEGFAELTDRLNDHIQIIGDDLFVTHVDLLKKGIERGVANAILIKLNQVGTVTETLECIRTAQRAGYGTIISHRSGETLDTSLVDLAVATSSPQVKMGSVSRGERIAKYNRLLQIEAQWGEKMRFSGDYGFKRFYSS